jgi:uncharacterized membrane protein HdeD (DUF308 family)
MSTLSKSKLGWLWAVPVAILLAVAGLVVAVATIAVAVATVAMGAPIMFVVAAAGYIRTWFIVTFRRDRHD